MPDQDAASAPQGHYVTEVPDPCAEWRDRIAELEQALRDLIKCHGMPPAKDCGYLRQAKEVLGEF